MKDNYLQIKSIFVFILFISMVYHATAQNVINGKFGDGIKIIAQDSSFYTKFGVRFQTLYTGNQNLTTSTWNENFLIRRYRLKFDGYVVNPKIVYKLELGISNRDTKAGAVPESGTTASIILDAVIKWNFAGNWQLWAGQTKLPGNRERVISSQKLQFVDRSLVNSNFTLDRDIGIQLHHRFQINNLVIKESLAIAEGEGRNVIVTNPKSGRQFTGRLEFLPMGNFTNKGDSYVSDLMREEKPKFLFGVAFDFNKDAARSRGNLGSYNLDSTGAEYYITSDLKTLFLDGLFKYKGISVFSEYSNRNIQDKVDGFGYGSGFMGSLGYLLKSNYEIAGRYTQINSFSSLSSIQETEEFTLAISKYIRGHNFKIQSDLSYQTAALQEFIVFRLQCELAL